MRASIAFVASLFAIAAASPLVPEKRALSCPDHPLAGTSPNNIAAENWYLQSSTASTRLYCYYNHATDGSAGDYLICGYNLSSGSCEYGWCSLYCEPTAVSA